MLITGGGRCNVTNNSSLNDYVRNHFYKKGNFYRQAFNNFFNSDIINLLEENGCKTKVEENNRVFPVSDKSKSVVDTLISILDKSDTKYELNANVKNITKSKNLFLIESDNKVIKSRNVILATGGKTYQQTGSTGDGHKFATSLGHEKTKFIGALAPYIIEEKWINKLQGITIDVYFEIKANKKKIAKAESSIVFTHNGISGIEILNNSLLVKQHLNKNEDVKIYLDLAHEYNYEMLDNKLQKDFIKNSNQGLKRYLHEYLPKNMVEVFLNHVDINPDTKLNQVTQKERFKIRDNLKRVELNIKDVSLNDSFVSFNGIKHEEIDPNTFESKIVPNLYIVGELVEGCGTSGGYNLQKAFSTGVLAAKSIKENSP